jgi:hypothetical protein
MKTLEKEIKKVIKEKEKSLNFESLKKINDEFNKLINEGLTSPRGYNLMTIDDIRTLNYEINC